MAKVHITLDDQQVERILFHLNNGHDYKLTKLRVQTALKNVLLEEQGDGTGAKGCSTCAGGCSIAKPADIGYAYEDEFTA